MPASPQSPALTEQDYLGKAKPFARKLTLGLFIVFILAPLIGFLSIQFHSAVILLAYILFAGCYAGTIPSLFQYTRRTGLGIWMSSTVIMHEVNIYYIGAFGLLAAAIENAIIFIARDGFDRIIMPLLMLPIILVLFCLIGIHFLFNYTKNRNLHRRSLWLSEDLYIADDGFHKALASLNLKTSKVWVKTKRARYSTYQIDDYFIQYNIQREHRITTIELNPTKPEFLPKMADIEKAVSAQFGFLYTPAEKASINQ
jgi:hypothetical protein